MLLLVHADQRQPNFWNLLSIHKMSNHLSSTWNIQIRVWFKYTLTDKYIKLPATINSVYVAHEASDK